MEKDKIKIYLFGTADISVPSFEVIMTDDRFQVLGLVTQPDKPVGRKQVLTPSPTKALALKYHIPVMQPEKLRDISDDLSKHSPDIILVIAYGKLIPREILDIPEFGCINVHASLLPKYRGAACVQAPILKGDSTSGVTIMLMDEGLDTGPIINQYYAKLDEDETAQSLHDKLAGLASAQLPNELIQWVNGETQAKPQKNEAASYVPKLKKENGHIDWHLPAYRIERKIRAYSPWPGTYGYIDLDGQRIFKIISVDPSPVGKGAYDTGELFLFNKQLAVACGSDALLIREAQLEGKKKMGADELLRGHKELIGKKLS